MRKVKYKFNQESLTFEKHKRSTFEVYLITFGLIAIFFVGGFFIHKTIFSFYDTPKEKKLKRELSNMELQYKLLNSKLRDLEQITSDLEFRDANIYRVIFEAEPIPSTVRNAGIGGIERYSRLEGFNNSELIIESSKKVDNLKRKLYVLSKSFDDIAELALKKEEMLSSIPAIQPIANKDLTRIASGYGWRIHPIYKVRKFHDGLDFTAPRGTEIYATGDGKVVEVEYSRRGYGNRIVIDHGYGYKTQYAHLDDFNVKKGQMVKRGEPIGTLGNTGLSTAPHLHYEVWYKNNKVNPINFFHNDLNSDDYEKVLILAEQANQALD